jgi:uncharacterized protein (DUF302 family)
MIGRLHVFPVSIVLLAALTAAPTTADAETRQVSPARPGWAVQATPHRFSVLVQRLEDAVKANRMGLVTAASASEGAKAQGFDIPGNRVVGVFRNDFARRLLAADVAAGIEAPIRFYLTENPDGTATLSYKLPSAVLAPYRDGSPAEIAAIAAELDGIFAKIADDAVKP